MVDPSIAKNRAKASRLRKKLREGKTLKPDEDIFLSTYNELVGGRGRPPKPIPQPVTALESNTSPESDTAPALALESDTAPALAPVRESVSVYAPPESDIAKPHDSNICTVDGCPCKNADSRYYCPVLGRKVYSRMTRDTSYMYARAMFGAVKFILGLFSSFAPDTVSADEIRSCAMGIRSLQQNFDRIAALDGLIQPLFGLVAIAGYVNRSRVSRQVKTLETGALNGAN